MIYIREKFKPLLTKNEIFNMDYIRYTLTASTSSTKFGVINLAEKNEQVFPIRGNTNVLIVSPFGTGKTTQIFKVNNVKIVNANDLTFAGVVGTISKEGQLVIGACMKAGGKLLIIDEAQKIKSTTKNAMNSILEPPHIYSRTLGYNMSQFVNKKGKYCWVRGSENTFTLYSKFSCIASQMYVRLKSTIDWAWWSRFMHIRLKITEDYMKKMLMGDNIFDINASEKNINFTFKDYLDFHKFYFDNFDKSIFKEAFERKPEYYGYLSRNIGDIIRLSAFAVSLEGGEEIHLDDAKRIFDRYWKISMYNALMNPLTSEEYTILNNMDKQREEIASLLGVSESRISQLKLELYKKGLVSSGVKDMVDNCIEIHSKDSVSEFEEIEDCE